MSLVVNITLISVEINQLFLATVLFKNVPPACNPAVQQHFELLAKKHTIKMKRAGFNEEEKVFRICFKFVFLLSELVSKSSPSFSTYNAIFNRFSQLK